MNSDLFSAGSSSPNEEQKTKKVYPSQLNSKTISARIPVADYVNFMQDALNKGISLNDWLLMKIYVGETVISVSRQEVADVGGIRAAEFWDDEKWPIIVDKEQAILQLVSIQRKQDYIEFLKSPRIASVDDIKTQLTILMKNKFNNVKERAEYRREIYKLLSELEETE